MQCSNEIVLYLTHGSIILGGTCAGCLRDLLEVKAHLTVKMGPPNSQVLQVFFNIIVSIAYFAFSRGYSSELSQHCLYFMGIF